MPQLLQFIVVALGVGLVLVPETMVHGTPALHWAALVVAVPALLIAFPIMAGLAAYPNRRFIRAGRFARTASDPVYGRRRYHAACWTLLFYSPVWQFVLAWPWLRTAVFRLFGYRGSTAFTLYPDTWIRDLPVLSIGDGAYLANKSTIGTNLVLADGTLLVGPISIGEKTIIGHLTMIAAGSSFGAGSEVLHGTAAGIDVQVGAGSVVEAVSLLDHRCRLGNGVTMGSMSHVGRKAHVGDGIRLPAVTFVPAGIKLRTQADADLLLVDEGRRLRELRERLSQTSHMVFGD